LADGEDGRGVAHVRVVEKEVAFFKVGGIREAVAGEMDDIGEWELLEYAPGCGFIKLDNVHFGFSDGFDCCDFFWH
jgi:hypothetical protein